MSRPRSSRRVTRITSLKVGSRYPSRTTPTFYLELLPGNCNRKIVPHSFMLFFCFTNFPFLHPPPPEIESGFGSQTERWTEFVNCLSLYIQKMLSPAELCVLVNVGGGGDLPKNEQYGLNIINTLPKLALFLRAFATFILYGTSFKSPI